MKGADLENFFNTTFLGYRKYTVMLLVIIIAVVFRIENLIDGGQFDDLLKNTVLAFFGGNAAEHFTMAARSYFQKTTTAQPRPDNPDAPQGGTPHV